MFVCVFCLVGWLVVRLVVRLFRYVGVCLMACVVCVLVLFALLVCWVCVDIVFVLIVCLHWLFCCLFDCLCAYAFVSL